MNVLSFNHQGMYSGEAIVVPVQFRPPSGVAFEVRAMVDTGAWMSVFDKAIAPTLGISDLTRGTRVPMTPASGTRGEGYAFPLAIVVLGRALTVPIAFVPSWPDGVPNLLGMRGFLDQFGTIAVDHGHKAFYYGST